MNPIVFYKYLNEQFNFKWLLLQVKTEILHKNPIFLWFIKQGF